MMTFKDKIFLETKAWAEEKLSLDPGYFERLGGMHTPDVLWIGSSDNLVSPEELANAEPGEIMLCRNLGSQVREDDIAMMAMIEDAVLNAGVSHIVVCGYSHCSGIRQVLNPGRNGEHLNRWLENLNAIYRDHREELDRLEPDERRHCLAALNIELQVKKLAKLDCILKSWEKQNRPTLYGWYFDLSHGAFSEVCSMKRDQRFTRPEPAGVLQL